MVSTKNTLVVLVADRPGVLNKVASLFRRRGFNIENIAVGSSEEPGVSRMTILMFGSPAEMEQLRKQLDKLIDVIKVFDLSEGDIVSKELALVKVNTTPGTRSEIMQIVDIYRANIVDVAPDSLTIEATGNEEKIESLLNLLRNFGIKEIARTGQIAMTRGNPRE